MFATLLANALEVLGGISQAEAERTARVGIAQAMAVEEQVRAYGGPKFQLTQQVMARFAQAIETAQVDVVPKILIGGNGQQNGGNGGGGNVMEALLAMLLSDKLGAELNNHASAPSPAAEALRKSIQAGINNRS